MIYSLRGTVVGKTGQFAVVDVHGVGMKVAMPARTLSKLEAGSETEIFTHLHVREDALDLYGFTTAEELEFFEMVIGVSGVGPKSALSILDVAPLPDLLAAIQAGRPDLMTRASGVGRKTGERIILELRGKVLTSRSDELVERMEGDNDLLDTLIGLGYRREQAKAAIDRAGGEGEGLESRLKAALKILGTRK